jgi:SAM-dependent methyltransferase
VVDGVAEALPVEDDSTDIAIAGDVLEHVPDDAAAVREMARALRPGGTALVAVPAYPWLFGAHDRAVGHQRRYTRASLVDVLGANGLRPVRVTYLNALLFPLAVPGRVLRRSAPAHAESTRAPGPLDAVFYRVFRLERRLLARVNLPFGLSLAAIAEKPGTLP